MLGSIDTRGPRASRTNSFSALRRAVLGSIETQYHLPPGKGGFQCSPTSRVGVNQSSMSSRPCRPQVSVLSDEPCWGQSTTLRRLSPREPRFQCSPTSRVGVNTQQPMTTLWRDVCFSALRRAVLGSMQSALRNLGETNRVSVLSDEPCWGQCFRSSSARQVRSCFSALRRAVLGSISRTCWAGSSRRSVSVLSDEPCWGQSLGTTVYGAAGYRFQCSPTSRVGVNFPRHALIQRPGRQFQCSPTSRVGVNKRKRQTLRRLRRCFSALRRAVLGSMRFLLRDQPDQAAFQCSPTSRVGVNPQARETRETYRVKFQCSPTSRVGVNLR